MVYLHFDFLKNPTTFENPVEIIVAHTVDEVIPAMLRVEEAIDNGYYAAGFLSYEAAPAFEETMKIHSNYKMPLLWFGIFSERTNNFPERTNSFYTSPWDPNTTIKEYKDAIQEIRNHIQQGETYQVNYTIRMEAKFHGDPLGYYQHLANSQVANYSAYLDIGDYKILSASPELFFHLKDNHITVKPMKGTVGRGETEEKDDQLADWLYHSEKNRAENVMIVDLLRNDLGRIARPGTVNVPALFSIEKYPTVHQMTSTITAELESNITIVNIFKALFPCGSITGAPKISTMNIINDLESTPRDVYCGAIGYITPQKEAIFNVPIRTAIIDRDGNATYGVGGGITWDSDSSEEYEEVLTKTKVLSRNKSEFQLLETIGLVDGQYIVLDYHLNRLKNSAAYFHFAFHEDIVLELTKLANQHPTGRWKVRILLNDKGETSIEITRETPVLHKQLVSLAKQPINKEDIFLYHKTTNRTVYENAKSDFPEVFDVLLWNEQKEVTEFTRGNIIIEKDGSLYTPPISCGLLPGTFRESLIDEGKVSERIIHVNDLFELDKIWFINSVKEWIEVQMV
ncbi:aminodeoxychorismate synthase component I [Ornithinibacillus halotolerans]|uniref:Aminodeoxychorismate synthase, component I n=1 Tax=Ornithinibacillus halotolerans TaxID=1274357 RepID=A0A916S958_9BACI|nr:aminodeoxychorismate synthase component I [Ornithinibacillus halotolerans]GGA89431.1 aminodeoxychorismate synthase, component I [Ornithinibacillus halotolerans]